MKFTIQRQAFTQQLAHVLRAIPSKATIPILTGIKIQATEEGITLIGSDADISIESFMPVEDSSFGLTIEETGSIVVTARLFNDIIRKLPTSEIKIESNEQFLLTISSGPAVFTLNGQDGNNFPHLPEIDASQQIHLPTAQFKALINNTIFSASNQESRPILTGVNLTAAEDHLTAVATDSHRLSRREIPIEIASEQLNFDALTIPKKTLVELERIVEDDQKLSMIVTGQQVVFTLENLTIYSRLLEGNYPDTDSLIPASYETQIVVNAGEFSQAIERASLMSHQGKNNVVQLDITPEQVELSVQGNERGKVSEIIKSKNVEGQALKISFNPDYMKDALGAFQGQDIKIDFQTPVRPLLLTAVEESDVPHNGLVQLLTPIRTH